MKLTNAQKLQDGGWLATFLQPAKVLSVVTHNQGETAKLFSSVIKGGEASKAKATKVELEGSEDFSGFVQNCKKHLERS